MSCNGAIEPAVVVLKSYRKISIKILFYDVREESAFLDTQVFFAFFFSYSPCFSRRFYSNIYNNIII